MAVTLSGPVAKLRKLITVTASTMFITAASSGTADCVGTS